MRGSKISSLAVILAAFGAGKLAIDSLSSKNQVSLDKVQQVKQNSHDYSSEDLEIKSYINSAIETQKQSNLVSESYSNREKYQETREELINSKFIETIIFMESSGNPGARNNESTARGLMQILRGTWEDQTKKIYGEPLPFNKAYDPEINRIVGTHYLHEVEDILSRNLTNWSKLSVDEKKLLIAVGYMGPYAVVRADGLISNLSEDRRARAEKYTRLMKKD